MEDLFYICGIIGLILFVMGSIFFIIGFRRSRLVNRWKKTSGIIVKKEININISLSKIISGDSFVSKGPDYHPTVQYTVDGVQHEYTSNVHQQPGIPIGKEVEVRFNPDNPEQAIINTFVQRGSIFTLIGGILLSMSLILFIVAATIYFV